MGRGYVVPPDRVAGVRSAVRRLTLIALLATLVLVVIVPRLLEWWLGFTLPLSWFIVGAVVVVVVIVGAINHSLSRLVAGLGK